METINKESLVSWLKEQEQKFNDYLNEVRRNKLKALSPKVQGQVMASAGCIAFIHAQLEVINKEPVLLVV